MKCNITFAVKNPGDSSHHFHLLRITERYIRILYKKLVLKNRDWLATMMADGVGGSSDMYQMAKIIVGLSPWLLWRVCR